MFRGVLVVVMAAVAVLLVLAMVMIASNGATAAAQQTGPPAAPRSSDPKVQPAEGDLKALARAAEEWVRNNPKGKTEAVEKPVPKDNAYPQVKLEEREAAGLPGPTWVAKFGKVQPAVREALHAQRKRIEEGGDAMIMQTDRPFGLWGTAYVDIYLSRKGDAASSSEANRHEVSEAQSRLMSKLSALDLSVSFTFKDRAAIVGYVNETGLEKLLHDPLVVAVGLDDQARPEPRPRAMHDEAVFPRDKQTGKIDPEVYDALAKNTDGEVYMVMLLNEGIPPDGEYDKLRAAAKETQDRVLASLSAAEFQVAGRTLTDGLDGYINAAGLAKLEKLPDVRAVRLDGRVIIHNPIHDASASQGSQAR